MLAKRINVRKIANTLNSLMTKKLNGNGLIDLEQKKGNIQSRKIKIRTVRTFMAGQIDYINIVSKDTLESHGWIYILQK